MTRPQQRLHPIGGPITTLTSFANVWFAFSVNSFYLRFWSSSSPGSGDPALALNSLLDMLTPTLVVIWRPPFESVLVPSSPLFQLQLPQLPFLSI